MHRRLLVLSLLAATTWAQEAEFAEKVIAAAAAKDSAALRRLAAADDPDRWLVVDEICARGELGVAAAFAAAAAESNAQEARLPAYVASRPKVDDGGADRAAFAEAISAFGEKRFEAALASLDRIRRSTDDVLRANVGFARGNVLGNLGRSKEAAEAFADAAAVAERIGWVNAAAQAWEKVGLVALAAGDLRGAVASWERQHGIEVARRDAGRAAVALGRLGACHRGLGDVKTALDLCEQALAGAEKCGDRASATWIARNVALCLDDLGRTREAVVAYERAIETDRAAGDLREEALALNGLGACLRRIGDPRRSVALHMQAAGIAEDLGDRAVLAECLGSAANTHIELGEYDQARALAERAHAMYVELGDPRQAQALMSLAGIRQHLGDSRGAADLYERCRQLAEAEGNRRFVANCLYGKALCAYYIGEYAKARGLIEECVRIQREIGGVPEGSRALTLLGDLYGKLGDLPRAVSHMEAAREEARRKSDALGEAVAVSALGGAYFNHGHLAQSLAMKQQALALAEAIGAQSFVADQLASLGSLYQRLGDLPRALSCQQRALVVHEALGERRQMASRIFDLGTILRDLGRYDEALVQFDRARSIAEQPSMAMAEILSWAGTTHQRRGDRAAARLHYEQARAAYRELGAAFLAADCLADAAELSLEEGDLRGALELGELALAEARSAGAGDRILSCLRVAAKVRRANGRAREALEATREGIALVPAHVRNLSETEGAHARSKVADLFETGILAGVAIGDPQEVLFHLESGRAGTLMESLAMGGALFTAVLPRELLEMEVVARAREAAAAEENRRAAERGDVAAVRATGAALAERRTELADAIQRIQREAKSAASIAYPQADGLAAIRKRLREGEALVLYALLSERSIALVITAGAARIVDLGSTADVADACAALVARAEGAAEAANAVRRRFVEPLRLEPGTTRLLVSPDGVLSCVPMTLVFGDRDLAYVPSGTAYGLLLAGGGRRGEAVLALGDPDYGARRETAGESLHRDGAELTRLPASADEARSVGTEVLLGKEATEGGLRRALATRPSWRAVHLACHGTVDRARPSLSCLAVTPSEGDDGFLTAFDVLRLRVPADLVVLSACETAKGASYRAEGVMGFVRSFMLAGAPRVIVSLWKVDDEATRALMVRFYELWNPKDGPKGLPTATALRKAMEFVRDHPDHREWKHPRYWAAWQLWGLPD